MYDPWTDEQMDRVLGEMAEDLTPLEWADIIGVPVETTRRMSKTSTARTIIVACKDAVPAMQAAALAGVSPSTIYRARNAAQPWALRVTAEARQLLGKRKISEFARHVGRERSTVTNWFSGGVHFPPSYLRKLREWDTN